MIQKVFVILLSLVLAAGLGLVAGTYFPDTTTHYIGCPTTVYAASPETNEQFSWAEAAMAEFKASEEDITILYTDPMYSGSVLESA